MLTAVYVSNARKILGADVTQIDTRAVSPATGCTLELCAGIVDKNASVEEIARDEVKEECGYDIPTQHLQVITVCRFVYYMTISSKHDFGYFSVKERAYIFSMYFQDLCNQFNPT